MRIDDWPSLQAADRADDRYKWRRSYWRKVERSKRLHLREALTLLPDLPFTLRTGGRLIVHLYFDNAAANGAILELTRRGKLEVCGTLGLGHLYRKATGTADSVRRGDDL